ncbi:MAG: hypothetical protein WCS15_03880 [Prevotella sp.]|nr:hypothetical protein [Prevotella sp.]MDT3388240.1 DUF1579 domain-containing protein [Bacteroidota bacterium]
MKKFILALFIFLPCMAFAQTTKKDSIWAPMRFFIGQWTGKSEGTADKGVYERTYKPVLNDNFIEVNNKTTFEPTAEQPKGEVHEDMGFISYDKSKKKFVLRQFHIESFVNTYVMDSISPDHKTMVFVSDQIENIKPGWRARETYNIINENEFVETFELAEPNKDFEVYKQGRMTRLATGR